MKLLKIILLLTMPALYLSACGGAVEHGVTDDDTTAPILIQGDPTGPTLEVCSITAEFDDSIQASTITDHSFIITKNDASDPLAAGNGTWGISPSSDTVALFTPTGNLAIGSYTVKITTAITNTAGINLEANQTWAFTSTLPCSPTN